MPSDSRFVSDLVRMGAPGYAAEAANLLLERHPETAVRFGDGAFRQWQRHLANRLEQLAAALLVDEPEMFARDALWARWGFEAWEVPVEDLVASLGCLRETLAEELPEEARKLPDTHLEMALRKLDDPGDPPPSEPGVEPGEGTLPLRFLEAALSGDRRRAIELVLEAIDDGLSVQAAYTDVLAPVQRITGEMWHRRQLSVPQEHVITANVTTAMALVAERGRRAEPSGRSVLVAFAPGNAHQLAGRALADLLEIRGWRAIYLGGEVPPGDLALAVEQFDVDLLAMSVALSTQLPAAIEAIAAARAVSPELKVLVGGGILVHHPELWKALGADAGAASLDDGLELADELVPGD